MGENVWGISYSYLLVVIVVVNNKWNSNMMMINLLYNKNSHKTLFIKNPT